MSTDNTGAPRARISLDDLAELFARSASDPGLSASDRKLAARCRVLTEHVRGVRRTQAALIANMKQVKTALAGIPDLIAAAAQPAPPAPSPAQVQTPAAAPVSRRAEDEGDIALDDADALRDQMLREAEEEAAAAEVVEAPKARPAPKKPPQKKGEE